MPAAPSELALRVQRRLDEPGARCLGLVTPSQIELRMRQAERRFWSPQLVVTVRPRDGNSVLTGQFGPDAYVWSMFLAMYAFVVLSTIFGMFYGVAQWMIDRPPWAFWSIPVALVLLVLIYVAAGIGQRLGHDHVDALQEFLEGSLEGITRPEGSSP